MPQPTKPRAFVLMPFSPTFDRVYRDIITPAFEGYVVARADSHFNQQNILKSIAEGIAQADLIIADVTDTNANVMYELGAAHSLGKPTVMISQNSSKLPFDLRSYPVQVYTSEDDNQFFAQRLREIAMRHSAGQLRFGNPITDFLPVGDAQPVIESRFLSELPIHAESDYGYLDFTVDMQDYGAQLLGQFGRLGELNVQLTNDIRSLSPPLQHARAAGDTKTERSLTNDFAVLVQRYARTVRTEVLPAFHEGWERVGHAMHWMASQKPADAPESAVANVCAEGQGLRTTLAGMIDKVVAVRESVLVGRGRTGQFDKAIRDVENVFNDFVGEVMIADAVLAKVYERLGCPPRMSA